MNGEGWATWLEKNENWWVVAYKLGRCQMLVLSVKKKMKQKKMKRKKKKGQQWRSKGSDGETTERKWSESCAKYWVWEDIFLGNIFFLRLRVGTGHKLDPPLVRIHVHHESVDGGHPCIIFKMINWILSFRQQIKHISLVS